MEYGIDVLTQTSMALSVSMPSSALGRYVAAICTLYMERMKPQHTTGFLTAIIVVSIAEELENPTVMMIMIEVRMMMVMRQAMKV
jgi:hypothetical protein